MPPPCSPDAARVRLNSQHVLTELEALVARPLTPAARGHLRQVADVLAAAHARCVGLLGDEAPEERPRARIGETLTREIQLEQDQRDFDILGILNPLLVGVEWIVWI